MAQIKTRRVTWSSIVGAAAFREGVEDYQAGRAPNYDRPKGNWQYERGRRCGQGPAAQPPRPQR